MNSIRFAFYGLALFVAVGGTPRAVAAQAVPAPMAGPTVTPGAPARSTEVVPVTASSLPLPGGFGTIVFPAGASVAGNVALSAALGAYPEAPFPPNDNAPAASEGPTTIVETIGFTFDRDIVFPGFPSFEITQQSTNPPFAAPFLIEIFDATTKERLAVFPNMERVPLTFLGRYTNTFRAIKDHEYLAELVKNPYESQYAALDAPQTLAVPAIAGGIRAIFELPASKGQEHGPSAVLFPSTTTPVGIPALRGPFIRATPYFVNVVFSGAVQTYAGTVGLTISLPPGSLPMNANYGIAVYDPGRPTLGWRMLPVSPTVPSPNLLHFTLPDASFYLSIRPYAVALFVGRKPASTLNVITPAEPPAPARGRHTFTIAAVGASTLRLALLPGTPAPCSGGWTPLPSCQFTADPRANIPGVVERLTGARVLNFATLGSQTILDTFLGPSMLTEQVPQLPKDTDVVILDIGNIDLGWTGQNPATSSHVDVLTAAVHAQAPAARIIYFGLRCYIGCVPAAIDAWNGAEQKAAQRDGGVWFDTRPYGPEHASEEFPDGGHPSLAAAEAIGADLAKIIEPWMQSKPR
jgi:hypothetical protein